MKTQEYLITFKNKQTLELIDMFYIDAIDLNNARQIAHALTHDYNDVMYFEISATVETA